MNGVNIGSFDLSSPPDTQSAGLGDDAIRSVKSTLQQSLDDEHVFSSAGGIVGAHRLGSARAYVGSQSQVSSSGTEGRLMFASDTSRFFHVGSGGTSYIGGPMVISTGSYPGAVPQRHYWAEEFGAGVTGSSGSTTVTITNSGFSGLPFIFVTVATPVTGVNVHAQVHTDTASSFIVSTIAAAGSSFVSDTNFFWRSIGTRVL